MVPGWAAAVQQVEMGGRTCHKCKLSGPTLDLLNKKLQRRDQPSLQMILAHAQVRTTALEPELSSNYSERTFSPVSAYTYKLILFFELPVCYFLCFLC